MRTFTSILLASMFASLSVFMASDGGPDRCEPKPGFSGTALKGFSIPTNDELIAIAERRAHMPFRAERREFEDGPAEFSVAHRRQSWGRIVTLVFREGEDPLAARALVEDPDPLAYLLGIAGEIPNAGRWTYTRHTVLVAGGDRRNAVRLVLRARH